jgi:DNA polymerase-3 subunit gamma/tau
VGEFVDALAAKNVAQGLGLIHRLLTDGASLNEFCQQVIDHLRGVLMVQMTGDVGLLDDLTGEAIQQVQRQAKQLTQPLTLYAIKRFSEAIPDLKGGHQPQLPLELALIEAIQGGPVAPVVVQQVVQQVVQAPAGEPGPAAAPAVAGEAAPAKSSARPPAKRVEPEPPAKAEPAVIDAEAARLLRARWKEFLAAVKAQCGPNLPAALQAVRDMAVSDRAVAFAFGNNDFSRGLVAKPEHLPAVTAVLSGFLGREVTLECQMGEKAVLAGKLVGVEAPIAGPDPLVEFAVQDLGAQVIDD